MNIVNESEIPRLLNELTGLRESRLKLEQEILDLSDELTRLQTVCAKQKEALLRIGPSLAAFEKVLTDLKAPYVSVYGSYDWWVCKCFLQETIGLYKERLAYDPANVTAKLAALQRRKFIKFHRMTYRPWFPSGKIVRIGGEIQSTALVVIWLWWVLEVDLPKSKKP